MAADVRAAIRGEVVAYALLAAAGGYLVVTSFGYGLRNEDGSIGPGMLPLVIGTCLVVLTGLELVGRLRGTRTRHRDLLAEVAGNAGAEAADPAQPPDGTDIFGRTESERVRQLWTVVAAMLGAILLVPLCGFLLAFGALVMFISVVVERRPVLTAAVVTAVSVAAVHVVFVVLLGVPLPGGLLGLGA